MARNKPTTSNHHESDDSLEGEEEEEELPSASQESNSSDAPNLENMLNLLEQLKTSRVKKKRDAEKKFLKAVKGRISTEITGVVNGVTAATESIDQVYSKFMEDYITIEDQIRKKWTEIRKEQTNMLTLIGNGVALHVEEGDKIEEEHIEGMASMKEACENMVTVINSLAPQSF